MFDPGANDAMQHSVHRFVTKTAVPREFAINALLNGSIAFLVFRNRDAIPVLGWGGLMSMVGPMSILLPWLTSFFGIFSCEMAVRFGHVVLDAQVDRNWVFDAVRIASINTLVVCPVLLGLMYLFDSLWPLASFSAFESILMIGAGSAIVASLIHAYCIYRYFKIISLRTAL